MQLFFRAMYCERSVTSAAADKKRQLASLSTAQTSRYFGEKLLGVC